MNLNMEIGKKKVVYPSKKSINLYYQEDISTKISTLALDIIFVVVVVLGLVKLLVVDVLVDRNDALEKVESLQASLDQQMVAIQEYDEVEEEYARYSYKFLVDEMNLVDRMEILSMLENTVFENGLVSNVSITKDVVSLSFEGLNLEQCAQLIDKIQSYDIVKTVEISNQTGSANGTYKGNVTITLTGEDAGGEQ